MSSRCCS